MQGVNISLITGKAEELMAKMDLNSDNLISREEFTHMVRAGRPRVDVGAGVLDKQGSLRTNQCRL